MARNIPPRDYTSLQQNTPPQDVSEILCKDQDNKCTGWLDLKRDFCISAHENGHMIMSNGYIKSATGQLSRKFVHVVLRQGRKRNPKQ